MRLRDLEVGVVTVDGPGVLERADGQVLARPGQVYALRLHNHDAQRRLVVRVQIDGTGVTDSGLVLDEGEVLLLERPFGDEGRFTVFAEGDERVFGPDGGRGNPDLGLIEVRGRWEVLRPPPVRYASAGPMVPPSPEPYSMLDGGGDEMQPVLQQPTVPCMADIESAAGTGLTGHSDQYFVPVQVGELEEHETVVRLRLVIASVTSIQGRPDPRPLPGPVETPVPPRPRPRP